VLHHFLDERPWFEGKRFGIGTGLPIAWQGWALLAVYAGCVVGIALYHDRHDGAAGDPVFWSLLALATALFVLIAKRKTRGGWRWHWGWRIDDRED